MKKAVITTKRIAVFSAVISFFSHLSYLSNGFIWLDYGDIVGKRAIVSLADWTGIFLHRFADTGYYRPLITLLFSLLYHECGSWALPYHLTSVLLHTLVTVVSIFFLNKFLKLTGIPLLIAGLIIAIHPVSWFTVGSITSVVEILMTLFVLLAGLMQSNSRTGFILSSVFAFLSKETAVVFLPAILLLVNRKRLWLSLIALLILYGIARTMAVPEVWKTSGATLSATQWLGTRGWILSKSFFAYLSPTIPSFADTTPVVSLMNTQTITGWLMVFGTITLILKQGIRSRVSRILLLFLIFLSPLLNIIPLPRFWSPNYLYTGLIAFAGIMGILVERLPQRVIGIMFGILTLMAIQTYQAGFRFKDDVTLFLPEVVNEPAYKEGHFYLGTQYWKEGKNDVARDHLEQAIATDSSIISFVDRPAAMINLAGVYTNLGKQEKAIPLLEKVKNNTQGTNRTLAIYNLAAIADQKKDYPYIESLLRDELNDQSPPQLWLLYIKSLAAQGKTEQAQENMKEATRIYGDRLFKEK